jgi:hypothetical protein
VLPLANCLRDGEMLFAPFSDQLKLVQVIIGANSNTKRADVESALGGLSPAVQIVNTRLAFKSFRVVHQPRSSLACGN